VISEHMKFTISKHPRGLLLHAEGAMTDVMSPARLRQTLNVPISSVSKGCFVVPTNSAYAILEHFQPSQVVWDPELFEMASRQMEDRKAQTQAQLEVQLALGNPRNELANYSGLAKLDSHQLEAVAAISVPSLKGIAIFDEQGIGKTIEALAAFENLSEIGKVKRLLVIAPKSTLSSWILDCTKLFQGKYHVTMVSGNPASRRQAILDKHDILLISYDSAVRESSLLKSLVSANPKSYMLVVDESYFVKNPATERSEVVSILRPSCERVVVLCGTPAPNSPLDIVNQINIADGGVAFSNLAIPKNPQDGERVIRRALGGAIYLRRLKENVFPNIPSKEVEKVFVNLSPAQKRIYDRAHHDLILTIRSIDDREFTRQLTSFIARRVALLQICSNPGAIDPLYAEEPGKITALDKLIMELVDSQGNKVVVWSFFRHSLQAIADRFKSYGLVRIDGSVTKIEERMEAIKRFQEDPNIRIFLGNAAAAGAGITLTAAHHAIYESFSNQAAHYMQSVDRIHRRGQEHDVTYHVLLSKDTIENREFERLLEKERAGRDLLGDRYEEPITRDRFLADLGETL